MAKNQKNQKKQNLVHEDIPRNTKETAKRASEPLGRQKRKLIVIVMATLLSSAAFTALPLAVGWGIDALVAAIRTYDGSVGIVETALQVLWLPVALIAASALISGLLAYLQQYLIASVGEELTLSFRRDISAKLHRLPLRYFDTHKTGEVMSRVTNDLEKVSAAMQEGLPQFISSGFTILFAAITMLVLSPTLFAVVVVSLAVSMIATGYVSTWPSGPTGKTWRPWAR